LGIGPCYFWGLAAKRCLPGLLCRWLNFELQHVFWDFDRKTAETTNWDSRDGPTDGGGGLMFPKKGWKVRVLRFLEIITNIPHYQKYDVTNPELAENKNRQYLSAASLQPISNHTNHPQNHIFQKFQPPICVCSPNRLDHSLCFNGT